MADRRSVFTNERVIDACSDFVCAADEVWRLQRGSEVDCVFFQETVNGGKRITSRGSYQGTWILAPSGKLLAHVNTRNVERQLEVMGEGLKAWHALSPKERQVDPELDLSGAHRWESNLPSDGLVLERIGRELDPKGLESEPRPQWNRDFVWAAKSELTPHFEQLEVGDELDLDWLAQRLARFHLVDNVRGQTIPYAIEELGEAKLQATVIKASAGSLELRLTGRTAAQASEEWLLGFNLWTPAERIPHGIECELLGTATWDIATQSFLNFDLVALARRWGRSTNNGRSRDSSPGLIAFDFRMNERALEVAPTFVSLYGVDWITSPAIPTWTASPEECGLSEETR